MNPKHHNQTLIQEHERQQRTATLSRVAEEMRNKRASQRSIHTAEQSTNFFCVQNARYLHGIALLSQPLGETVKELQSPSQCSIL